MLWLKQLSVVDYLMNKTKVKEEIRDTTRRRTSNSADSTVLLGNGLLWTRLKEERIMIPPNFRLRLVLYISPEVSWSLEKSR